MGKAVRVRVRVRAWAWVLEGWDRVCRAGLARPGRRDAGMVTSEYAMGLIAAVGFAALLYEVLTSGQVRGALQDIVGRALSGEF
ncbi:hypothetical protein GCM10010372_34550 [Streptomyces tauricus]|uniref:DUF4244 domain-containing protein n=1 Tax=Streptomyces tauricus TaxID=68274 RepID=UPI0016793D4F|nr:DUF4244 domain-containing protein [Streptomyces tauricus]GHA31535.1 hypothetical protein GCM10010372_34550 [Streptomyces tauricus]